jgi:phosphoribosylformylglycinamidine synthase
MILFFKTSEGKIIAAEISEKLSEDDLAKLKWLFGNAEFTGQNSVEGRFLGPRKELTTPWSTNAVEITRIMGIKGIKRIEELGLLTGKSDRDPMFQSVYDNPGQDLFNTGKTRDTVRFIDNIHDYNKNEDLALSEDETAYLQKLSQKIGRLLTDSEIFAFSQINSEHCRHKIFNGTFIIDGREMEKTLFQLIKLTTKTNPNRVVSAYKDNCAFIEGPVIEQFAPRTQDKPDYFSIRSYQSVLSLKAETHNFPTTVEPCNGGSTGTGGEIRDRMAGGRGALPIAGTAVIMTSYPRIDDRSRPWEEKIKERPWLYHTPADILIKSSSGAGNYGNKFGQPLICGSVLTFEHSENLRQYGYDKVIMLAGGIGIGKKAGSLKGTPSKGDLIILLGGDNYRIGMGGGAGSSVDTGKYDNSAVLNAVQRANPEMQKRVYNAIRALTEMDNNPVISIHDHGAGGHLNCLSELVENTGGIIDTGKLPVGDPTLSEREIIGNESQERMALVLKGRSVETLRNIAERERAPLYVIGEITEDQQLIFINKLTGEKPVDLKIEWLLESPLKTIMTDSTEDFSFGKISYDGGKLREYLGMVLSIEEVACKDWLTNKADRSVTGLVARQQCAGPLQLPLNDLGAISLDYTGKSGMAVSVGHAPGAGLIDPGTGSVLSVAEALTNIIWAPLVNGLKSVSLSANWMWPSGNKGEDARLYKAVKAVSDFAISLGINIPTGKDSLSMTQKYTDRVVYSPGTVIITATGEVKNINRIAGPVMLNDPYTSLLYLDMSRDSFKTGGSSFAQVLNMIGDETPTVKDAEYFAMVFDTIQDLIMNDMIISGHDISAGGIITTLLEMCFPNNEGGLVVDLSAIHEPDTVKLLFSQNPGIVIQVRDVNEVADILSENGISYFEIGHPVSERTLSLTNGSFSEIFGIDELRDLWFRTSYLLDSRQTDPDLARERYLNYSGHVLRYNLNGFRGSYRSLGISPSRRKKSGIRAAVIREKGTNGDREMAYALYLAGFDVRDVHMTDLIEGRETLKDINMLVFAGGSTNSDVFGAAKGWAGAFRYNRKAAQSLGNYYKRKDTLSLGVCNGCQLMAELGLIYPEHGNRPRLLHNKSGKFEAAFLGVQITGNNSVMLGDMEGMELGVWMANSEGRFDLPLDEEKYVIPVKYSYKTYPGNPGGSDYNAAALCSPDGRHLAMMLHPERSIFPWQCAYYPHDKKHEEVTPWIKAFVNARKWIESESRRHR